MDGYPGWMDGWMGGWMDGWMAATRANAYGIGCTVVLGRLGHVRLRVCTLALVRRFLATLGNCAAVPRRARHSRTLLDGAIGRQRRLWTHARLSAHVLRDSGTSSARRHTAAAAVGSVGYSTVGTRNPGWVEWWAAQPRGSIRARCGRQRARRGRARTHGKCGHPRAEGRSGPRTHAPCQHGSSRQATAGVRPPARPLRHTWAVCCTLYCAAPRRACQDDGSCVHAVAGWQRSIQSECPARKRPT